ncbi:MAG TPA: DUF3570 domain-containing protein, partial [Gammaproteobacteria bacterium]
TPNGAYDTGSTQTFTSPSGNKTYTTAAGETPLDDSFHDTRVALSASWDRPVLDDRSRMILSGNVSSEFDYMSLGATATFLRDYNNRNTTLSAALGLTSDSMDPVGGVPVELDNMVNVTTGSQAQFDATRDGSSESKTITDVMFGVTQVISRKTLMQFNLGFSSTSGYQNDPYKVVSVVDASGNLLPQVGDDLPYVYENRPDSRSRQTFYWKTVHHLTEDVIHVAYRYYTDDWDVNSHTVDFTYRYELGNGAYLQPHLRYYSQSAAEFFRHSISDTELTALQASGDNYVSSDYRLGELTSTTLGLKYAMPVNKNSEFSVRAELINQTNNEVNVGTLPNTTGDITPDLDAVVFQVGYSFHW